jgi:ketosteroid isomerase-like protein
MSEENVELVMESIRRFTPENLDSWAELWHPDTRMTMPEGSPEPGPFVGLGAVRGQFERAWEVGSGLRVSDVKVVADQGEWVVFTYHVHTQGVSSGLGIEADLAAAYRIENGLLTEYHARWNADDALEAAGLSE